MKNAKKRVIAIDYFRGVLMLMVLLNHSILFSMPYTVFAGAGILWISAAEMFLLLSGITLWVVRGDAAKQDFKKTTLKLWRRAGIVYCLDILVVLASLVMALYFSSHGLTNDVVGQLPQKNSFGLLADILSFKYSIGWANFLMYYCALLFISPIAIYVLRTRLWLLVPLLSTLIFVHYASPITQPGIYGTFGIWQIYFFVGLTIGRFRLPILNWFYDLKPAIASWASKAVVATGSVVLALSIFLEFNIYPTVVNLVRGGWLPAKAEGAYTHYLNHKDRLDFLLTNSRSGLLRPLVALVFMAWAYILYQKYKKPLLRYTGNFINSIGRDSLWIFVAQAIMIPLLAVLPLSRTRFMNLLLISTLVLSMYALTKRHKAKAATLAYFAELKLSYRQSKNSYLQGFEEI